LRILISGAGGGVGRALAPALAAAGHTVTRLVRARPRSPHEYRWDPSAGTLDPAAVATCDAVVHLAGAGVADGRWTRARKAAILESRRAGTRLLATAIAGAMPAPRVFVCASAVGYYGDRGDEVLSEESAPGGGFLAEVVRVWEEEALAAAAAGVRVVRLRMGVVLDADSGALPLLLVPFRLGLGGPLGSGRQWMSWITMDDLLRAIGHVLSRAGMSGAVNAVAPGPVTNLDFSRALGRVLGRPVWLAAPAWALTSVLGEMGREVLLFSQRATPARLLADGFAFGQPAIEGALRRVLRADVRSD
jgi:hypothetical protein